MAAQALSAETNKSAFVDACALAAVDAAAARHRGLEVNVGGVSLSFYRARDGTLTCIETACQGRPHHESIMISEVPQLSLSGSTRTRGRQAAEGRDLQMSLVCIDDLSDERSHR